MTISLRFGGDSEIATGRIIRRAGPFAEDREGIILDRAAGLFNQYTLFGRQIAHPVAGLEAKPQALTSLPACRSASPGAVDSH